MDLALVWLPWWEMLWFHWFDFDYGWLMVWLLVMDLLVDDHDWLVLHGMKYLIVLFKQKIIRKLDLLTDLFIWHHSRESSDRCCCCCIHRRNELTARRTSLYIVRCTTDYRITTTNDCIHTTDHRITTTDDCIYATEYNTTMTDYGIATTDGVIATTDHSIVTTDDVIATTNDCRHTTNHGIIFH